LHYTHKQIHSFFFFNRLQISWHQGDKVEVPIIASGGADRPVLLKPPGTAAVGWVKWVKWLKIFVYSQK
jgi:hypothetical protein